MQQAADASWSPETLTRAASRGRIGASRAASQILAGSLPVTPGPAATAATSRLFATEPDPAESARMTTAVAAAMNIPARRRPMVQPKHVITMGRSLHAPASPGPWGFRNSYICAMLAHPRGPKTIARWTNWWASGPGCLICPGPSREGASGNRYSPSGTNDSLSTNTCVHRVGVFSYRSTMLRLNCGPGSICIVSRRISRSEPPVRIS